MKNIIGQLFFSLLRRPSLQISLLLAILAIGVFATLSYQNFNYLQAQNIDQLSLLNEIIKPLSGLVLFCQLFIIIIASSQIIPAYFERGQQGLLLHSSFSNSRLVGINFLVVFFFSLWPVIYFLLIGFNYWLISELDGLLLLSTMAGLLSGGLLFSLLVVTLNSYFKKSLTAVIASIVVLLLLFVLDEFLRNSPVTETFSLYTNLFLHLRNGLIVINEIIQLVLWLLILLSMALIAMKRLRMTNNQSPFFILAIALSLLVSHGLFTSEILLSQMLQPTLNENSNSTTQWDISRQKINSLSDDIAQKIARIKSPIVITAVIDDDANRDEIRQAFEVIKQYHHNSSLVFTSRQAMPNSDTLVGQFVQVNINGQQQTLKYPFDRPAKESFSQMIMHIVDRSSQWISFIEGHDEASPFSTSNQGISIFFQSLKNLGWPLATQNLIKQKIIAKNTKLLVIAASKKSWLVGEIDSLMEYLKRGGNLLLLREKNDKLPQELESFLAVKTIQGTLIDWVGYQSGTPHPAIVIVNQFNSHPVNSNISSLIAFPWSVGLMIEAESMNTQYQYQVISQTHDGAWSEFDSQQTELVFNAEKGEIRQAFTLALSLTNQSLGQKIIVVGDSSFLSNAAINNYANHQFSLNLVSWLSSRNIASLNNQFKDHFIRISRWNHFTLSWLFSLIIPGLLTITIFVFYLKNRTKKGRTQ